MILHCAPSFEQRKKGGRQRARELGSNSTMVDNMPAEADDEEGFGDFKFATLSPGFAVNPYPINGPDGGEFMNSASLSRTHSLPPQSDPAKIVENIKILADRNESVPDQRNSAPARASGAQWMKPKGALPLSIFGEEEEEEGSGAVGTSSEILSNRDIDSVKTLSNLKTSAGMNDLIASLHKHNDNIGVVNGLKPESHGSNLDSNINVWNSIAPEVLSNIFISNSGLNGLDLAKTVSSLDSNKPIPSPYVSNLDLSGLDSNRSATNSDARKPNLDPPGFNFVWSRTISGVEGLSSSANDVNGDLEDNDGWEFKAAEAEFEFQHEKAKNDQIKVDNGLTSSSSGSYSAPDMFSSDLKQLNFNVNAVNPRTDWLSTSTLGENKSANDDDQLKFTAAETKTEIKDKSAPNSNTDGSNASRNVWSSYSNGLNLKAKGVHVDTSLTNLDLYADGWEFKHAESETQLHDGSSQDDKKVGEKSEGAQLTGAFGTSTHAHTDLFAASDGTSYKSIEWDFGFNFKPSSATQNGVISNAYPNHKKIDTEIWSKPSPDDGAVGSDRNSWGFKDAFSESGSKEREEPDVAENTSSGVDAQAFTGKSQDNVRMLVNQKAALPLSLFGEEEQETDDSMDHQDFIAYSSNSDPRDDFKRPASNVPISDVISSLYSQVEEKWADDNTQNPQESGLPPNETPIDTGLVSSHDNLDDNSWEFEGAFSGVRTDDTFVDSIIGADKNNSTQIESNIYVEFYSELKDKLQFVAMCHLDSMKKSQSSSTISGEGAEVPAVDPEIQDIYDKLQHDGLISSEVHIENCSPGGNHLNEFVKALGQPKLLILESEYNLSKKLLLAEKDLRSAIELLKHVASTLKILTLRSVDEQRNYVSIWSDILSVCSRELKHGALVWKQSLEKNLHSQILCKPQGKKYIVALGEVYKVVEALGSSAKLFKPWLLLNSMEYTRMSALLNECASIWSSSGLEEALRSISDPTGLEYDGTVEALLQSIKDIHDLNADALYNHVFSGQQTTCRLSILTAAAVPGMKMVVWNGEHYFLTLANLWGNLISCDAPNLPRIHVG
ncbi:hypothetical protein HS088_TW12G01062 [Tripterygium wilfordii]|uniref:Synergin gamma C-terminal domain-containing protein n=1 Tax=Tripterygium wilfordii TaxID=458696 RepID=A0A7J7D0J2_TRIWF|nr:uncharacterized protein LOC120010997 [Tripterygium wilfordii]KAF5739851.1 hypothetical protein HS088_TW12G01062 [Tripterygium wilfordii]